MKKRTFTILMIVTGLLVMAGFTLANTSNVVVEETSKVDSFPYHITTTHLDLYNRNGDVIGVAGLVQMGKHVIVKVEASGLTPGKHGFHVHENPITNGDFTTAGAHFNPTNKKHGHDNPKGAHLGDMPNLVADKDGKVDEAVILEDVSLEKGVRNSILGKSLIIHAKEDDLKTDPSGDSGDRVAGGNIPQ